MILVYDTMHYEQPNTIGVRDTRVYARVAMAKKNSSLKFKTRV
jgi:hypothetical protein